MEGYENPVHEQTRWPVLCDNPHAANAVLTYLAWRITETDAPVHVSLPAELKLEAEPPAFCGNLLENAFQPLAAQSSARKNIYIKTAKN